MSKKIINQILGLAVVDGDFAQSLLKNPLEAVQAKGFFLTPEEQQVLSKVSANTLADFSQQVINKLNYGQKDQY